MTPDQVFDTIRNQVYETAASFWSDDEIYSYMWQAEQEIASLVDCTQSYDSSQTTTANEPAYSKPSDVLYLTRVTWDGVKLKKIDWRQKDSLEIGTYGAADYVGNPTHYVEWGNTITLYPIPDRSASLVYYYIAQPTQITATSTSFTVPQLFHQYLPDYCLYRMYVKDQDDGRAMFHKQLWEENIYKARDKWNRRVSKDFYRVVKDEEEYRQTEWGII